MFTMADTAATTATIMHDAYHLTTKKYTTFIVHVTSIHHTRFWQKPTLQSPFFYKLSSLDRSLRFN